MRRILFAVFAVSMALIAFEISLLSVLSITQWSHFASLVISVALLGFGAAGTVLALARRRMLDRFDRIVPVLLNLCAISLALVIPLSQTGIARFDSYLIFVESEHMLGLASTCLILAIPFLLGALAIGLCFVRYTDYVGRVYLWNLVGSGLGGGLAVGLMWFVEPQAIAPLCGLIAASGSVVLTAVRRFHAGWLSLIAAAVCIAGFLSPAELSRSQYKSISRALDLPNASIVHRDLSPLGPVEVVSAPALRSAPGLSLRFDGEVPVHRLAFVHGDPAGSLASPESPASDHLDYTTRALPFELDSVATALILKAGSGEAVRHAVSRGAEDVRAVEPHRGLTGLWSGGLDRTKVVNHDPRTWLDRDRSQYDLIVLPPFGSFGGTVGLEEAAEDYLLTREALQAAWDRLGPTGIMTVSVWLDYPYRAPLQVLSSLVDAMSERVDTLDQHLVAVRSWADVTFAVSRAPLSSDQSAAVRAFCNRAGFDPLLLPGIESAERIRYNALSDETLLDHVDALIGGERDAFVSGYPFHIGPVTDDRPYPVRYLRWGRLPELIRTFGDSTTPFFGLGLFLAALTFAQAIVLSLLLIVAPLVIVRSVRRGGMRTLLYFSGLGVGYLLIEIVFIHRFTLFLGTPVYAAAAVIAAMLIGSGIGSHFSGRFAPGARVAAAAASCVVAILLIYIPFLQVIFDAAISLDLSWRGLIALAAIIPPAFLMGFPFPIGLRTVAEKNDAQVPWAWGVNGFLSVVGASAAGLVAMEFGFSAVMIVGAASYVLAAAAMLLPSRNA